MGWHGHWNWNLHQIQNCWFLHTFCNIFYPLRSVLLWLRAGEASSSMFLRNLYVLITKSCQTRTIFIVQLSAYHKHHWLLSVNEQVGRGIQPKSHLSTTPSFNSFFQGKILLRDSHFRLKSPRNMSSMSQKSKYDLRCNLHRNEHHVLCHSKILKQITHVTFAEEEMARKVTGSLGQSKHPAIRSKWFNGENVASDTRMLWACTSMSLNLL